MPAFVSLPNAFYSTLPASNFPNPKIVWVNEPLAEELGLDLTFLYSEAGLAVLSGQKTLNGDAPLAMAYSGHQFGHYAPLLGDGRARLVAELSDSAGKIHDLHLKGAGQTPYSRRGDGRAGLGSAIREAIISEGMAGLGIPTTRSLAILTTGEVINRQTPETGAILARTARAHIRVGSLQFAAANLETCNIRALADWTIERLYPTLKDNPNPYLALFETVMHKQAKLIAQWMSLGFVHGVMNTDNMMLSGETVDYGPCAFIDGFHPHTVFSAIDQFGRYAWNRQADIGHWNLTRLAESLTPLIGDAEANEVMDKYVPYFQTTFETLIIQKLGLDGLEQDVQRPFISQTLGALTENETDFTKFFTDLTRLANGATEPSVTLDQIWFDEWLNLRNRLSNPARAACLMRDVNPVRIPRNHHVAHIIARAEAGDMAPFREYMLSLSDPYTEDATRIDLEIPPTADEKIRTTYCGT